MVEKYFLSLIIAIVLLTASILLPFSAMAEIKLQPSDGIQYDDFGCSVSLCGNYAVVGEYRNEFYGYKSGSAYVFELQNDGNWIEAAKLVPSDSQQRDYFGCSVSIHGNYTLVGAFGNTSNSGSAYIFQHQSNGSWVEVSKLMASVAVIGSKFGSSVSIYANYALVGAPLDGNNGSGAAYIFQQQDNGSWTQVTKLVACDGEANDYFGHSVSLYGSCALVGAYGDDGGSAYVFQRQDDGNWVEVAKLTASGGSLDDYFGLSVSLYGDYALVGAYGDDDKGSYAGSAYVFQRQGDASWVETGKIFPSDGGWPGAFFGKAVCIDDEYITVGAPGSGVGAVYVFQRFNSEWIQISKWTGYTSFFGKAVSHSGNYALVGASYDSIHHIGSAFVSGLPPANKIWPADSSVGDDFGCSVSLDGAVALVGSSGADENGENSGSAYIFQYRNCDRRWLETAKLVASDGADDDYFGRAVSLSGNWAAIGAPWDDDNGFQSGSVYIFRHLDNGSWQEIAKLMSSDGDAQNFGHSVSLNGNQILVGAYSGNNGCGAAYVFQNQSDGSWVEIAKLTASDAMSGDHFGFSVSLSGNYAMVGAYGDHYAGSGSGSVYIFQLLGDNWVQVKKLSAPLYDFFGFSVSLDGDLALVGATDTAFVFRRNGDDWVEEARLAASEDGFGYPVSLFGDYALIGTYGTNFGDKFGFAYIFKRQKDASWVQIDKLQAIDGWSGDRFGFSVSLSGNYALVGALDDDDNGDNSGSAYLISLYSNINIADFNGDGSSDLLWHNDTTGVNYLWYFDGLTYLGGASVSRLGDNDWHIVGIADFNQDSHPDILWRNTSTGANYVWYMDDNSKIGGYFINKMPDTDWHIVGVSDFNGDTHPDILWRNISTGANYLWYLDDCTRIGTHYVASLSDTDWHIVGTADFNSDSHPDILWRNYSTGENYIYYMNDWQKTGSHYVSRVTDVNWAVGQLSDFNSDGQVDILWRNQSTGDNYVWYLNDWQKTGGAAFKKLSDLNWHMAEER